MDFDYASEQMIQDSALERYKVLVFLWGPVTEKSVLDRIDAWVQAGGTVIVPVQPRGFPSTVENDQSVALAWRQRKTSKGQAIFWEGDAIPTEPYAQFIREQLLNLAGIRPRIKAALRMSKPSGVFWSVLDTGKLALLNHRAVPASVCLSSGKTIVIEPYGIVIVATGDPAAANGPA